MKRGLIVFDIVMFIIGGGDLDKDIGVKEGMELGIGKLKNEDEDEMDSDWIRNMFMYEKNDMVEGIRIYEEIGIKMWLRDNDEEFWMGMDMKMRGKLKMEIRKEGNLGIMMERDYELWLGGDDEVGKIFREKEKRGELLRN